jgi:hypothetical protein
LTAWETWCLGVITGVGEPQIQTSVDSHWAWSNAETAPYDLMRWNNPQNSTEKWFVSGVRVSRDSGAQPGPHDVQIYPTVQDGIDATVYNLASEPFYPAICANLRAGLPRQQWGATSTAGSELATWGTGTNWLTTSPYFGPPPELFLGAFMAALTDLEQQELLADIRAIHAATTPASDRHSGDPATTELYLAVADIKAKVDALSGSIPPAGLQPVLNAISALSAQVSGLTLKAQ